MAVPNRAGVTIMGTLWRIAILLLASWGVCASGASAQGWIKYRAGLYEVNLPADWSCRYDEKARRVVAASSDKEIFLSVRAEPKGVGQRMPGDPLLLKKRLLREYELLNATDGTRYDVTTKNVAVETVNGLRGVVVELTAVVPAVQGGGALFLKKFSGFAFIAEGGGTYYFATILCPVGRFVYHSALMNRILNDLWPSAAAAETSSPGDGTTANGTSSQGASPLDGDWLLSHAGGKYRIELRVRGDSGTMRVRWHDERGKTFVIEQRIMIEVKLDGLRVKGSAPAYLRPEAPHPAYAPDTLLFQRQSDESWKVWIRDDIYVKQWRALLVDSYATLNSLSAQ